MADLVKRGGAAVQSSTMRNGSNDSSLLDSSDGQRHSPRPTLKLSMPGTSMPNDDLSSSSGESFFRGFRMQFPGFSKRDPTTADCSDSDAGWRNAGKQGDSRRARDDDEPANGDDEFEVIPPSPILQLNKKRLYHVPTRLRKPANVSKKLRLESAHGARPASLIIDGDASSTTANKSTMSNGESTQKPKYATPLLLRSNSEDASNHVLDETLATFHKIVADTSKIMEKLCTERKAPPPGKNASDGVDDVQRCMRGENGEKSSSGDGLGIVKVNTAFLQDSSEICKPRDVGLGKYTFESNTNNGENPSGNDVKEPCLERERFRIGGNDVTPDKSTKPPSVLNSPNFHWPIPSSSLKVAVVNPVLKLNSDHHDGQADKAPVMADSSHSRANDGRQGRTRSNLAAALPTRPISSLAAPMDNDFKAGGDEDASDTLQLQLLSSSRPFRNARTKNRVPLISSSSESDEGTLEAIRQALHRSCGDDPATRKAPKPEKDVPCRVGKKPQHLRYCLSSSSEEEERRGSKQNSRKLRHAAAAPDMHDVTMSPCWRTGHSQQEMASAYMLEDLRSPRGVKPHGSNVRRRIKLPRDWSVVDTSSSEDSDLEVITHVKPTKSASQMPYHGSAKDCAAAKDKRKYPTFPIVGDAYTSQRPGTSRMFDERPTCVRRTAEPLRFGASKHPEPPPRTQNLGRASYNDAAKSEANVGSYAARSRPDAEKFEANATRNRCCQDNNDNLLDGVNARGRQGTLRSRLVKSKTHPCRAHNDPAMARPFLFHPNPDLFDPELSSDEADVSPVRIVRPRRTPGSRRNERILSSSDTEVDEHILLQQQRHPQRRRERRLPIRGMTRFRRVVGDISSEEESADRDGSGSPPFNVSPLMSADAGVDSVPGPSGSGYRTQTTARGRPLTPLPDHRDSPGILDAVHRIEQIETDEAYARRLQAEFDAEANAVAPPQPPPNAIPVDHSFTPFRTGPSVPHRYSRSRNPSLRVANIPSNFRTSRPRQASTRSPSQQSLLNASRHRSSGGRMRGAPSYDGMTTAAVLPILDGRINRMLVGFQDEWMSLIASVAVPTIESDPEETSRGRSPRSLRRRPAARANASSDDTDIDGISFESLLTYSDDEDDYWQAGIRPATNQTGRTGARRRSRGRRAHGNYWTPNQGNDYEELLELAEQLGHVSRGLNRTQINRLPTHQFSKNDGNGGENVSRTTECHICMSEYENGERLRILPCFHDFHTNCIDRWLREKNTCPVCRLRVQVS